MTTRRQDTQRKLARADATRRRKRTAEQADSEALALAELVRLRKEWRAAERVYRASFDAMRSAHSLAMTRACELARWVAPGKVARAVGITRDDLLALLGDDGPVTPVTTEPPAEPVPVPTDLPVVRAPGEAFTPAVRAAMGADDDAETVTEHEPVMSSLPADAPLLDAEHVTRGALRHYGNRRTVFVSVARGLFVDDSGRSWTRPGPVSLGEILSEAKRNRTDRVYLTDGPDWCRDTAADTRAEAVRRWISQPVPGWKSAGHWVPLPKHASDTTTDARTPMGRYAAVDNGHRVDVMRAGSWFGIDGEYDPRQCARAWGWLTNMIAERFKGGVLLNTPGMTGRDLWLRSLPKDKEVPVMSAEIRALLAATAGQGRRELLPATDRITEVPSIVQYDGRMMYAGLIWGLPWGAPTRMTARMVAATDDITLGKLIMGPSRWRVRATVPDGWRHVGLLMTRNPGPRGRRWNWPDRPGESFETWCDGRELDLALRMGWRVNILEGMCWREGKLLDTWAKTLTDAADRAEKMSGVQETPEVCHLLRQALRGLILHAIGAFAMRSHPLVHSVPISMAHQADPYGRAIDGVHQEGDMLVWQEAGELPEWSRDLSHPEFAAQIWGRARVRLLDGPNGLKDADGTRQMVGALHVPRRDVIAFATDGIYLANDPQWQSSGAPGTFRRKGVLPGPVRYPQTTAELMRMRDAMRTDG